MPIEVRFLPCFKVTYIAGKRELSCMDPHMFSKVMLIIGFVFAVVARKFIYVGMS